MHVITTMLGEYIIFAITFQLLLQYHPEIVLSIMLGEGLAQLFSDHSSRIALVGPVAPLTPFSGTTRSLSC